MSDQEKQLKDEELDKVSGGTAPELGEGSGALRGHGTTPIEPGFKGPGGGEAHGHSPLE
jgi:hypothetical protein